MIKRYDGYDEGDLYETEKGDFVRYEDHQQEVEELKRKLDLANNHIKEAYQNGKNSAKQESHHQVYRAGQRMPGE